MSTTLKPFPADFGREERDPVQVALEVRSLNAERGRMLLGAALYVMRSEAEVPDMVDAQKFFRPSAPGQFVVAREAQTITDDPIGNMVAGLAKPSQEIRYAFEENSRN